MAPIESLVEVLEDRGVKVGLVDGHEDFDDFFVSAFDDEHMGKVPCIYFVLKAGAAFDRKKLVSHLRNSLPPSHVPNHFTEVEEVPRSESGKLLRGNRDRKGEG